MTKLKKDTQYLLHYWRYLSRYKLFLIFGFVLIPIISGFHILQPYLIKLAIDSYILPAKFDGFYLIVIFFASSLFLDYFSKTLQMYIFQFIGQKTVMDIRKDMYLHILNYSPSYFDKTPIGIMISRLTSDIESLNESFSSGLVTLLADMLTLIGIIVVMFLLSPHLTLVTVLVVPPMMVLVNFFRVKLRYHFDIIRSTIGHINGYIQEQLQGIVILQIFMQERKSFNRFKDLNARYYRSTIASVSYDAILYSLIDMINSIMIALIIWYGWGQYQDNVITIGVLVAFIEYIHKFFTPLKEISNKFATLQHALSALEKIFGTFEHTHHQIEGFKTISASNGTLCFEDVTFAYQGFENKRILDQVSFIIQPGEVFALVGPTGSGKTSILRLVSRLYDHYEGIIRIGEDSISQLTLSSLRSQVSIVTQDVMLFSGTIRFNITLDNESISIDRMIWAAKCVQIHDFIESLPNKYDTVLNKGDKSISAGQAQLISFARALASYAPILLLDEATSAVDSLSEQQIQMAMAELFKHKTTLVVAHRLSTIQKADQILVLNKGVIIERGTHSKLMQLNGFYAKLFHMQFVGDAC